MPTPSIKETISAHDEGEDLPRMGAEREALTRIAAMCPAYISEFSEESTFSDFGNADDYARHRESMDAARIGDIARLALSSAPQSDGWRPIADAPKNGVWQDGNNHFGEYILVWYRGALRALRARWWYRDDTEASNFIADGGHVVFPEVFMDLPAPPKMTQTQGQSHGE